MNDTPAFPFAPSPPPMFDSPASPRDRGASAGQESKKKRGPHKPAEKREEPAERRVSAYELGLSIAADLEVGEAAMVIRAIKFIEELPADSRSRVVAALAKVFG